MNFKKFMQEAIGEIRRNFPDYDVYEEQVEKLQNRSYNGLVVKKKDSNIGLILNIDDYYRQMESGRTFDEVMCGISDMINNEYVPAEDISMDIFGDYQTLKEKIVLQMVPAEGNEEVLLNIPHKTIDDLVIVYRVMLGQDENGETSILVTNENLKNFGITAEELMVDAGEVCERNYPLTVRSMESVLTNFPREMMSGIKLWVVGNEVGKYGAAVISYSNAFERIAEEVGSGYYIIPSSAHELLVLADSTEIKAEEIDRIVSVVNSSEVCPEDRLTDHSYHYDNRSGIFERATVYEERMAKKQEAVCDREKQGIFVLVKPGKFPEIVNMGIQLPDLQKAVGGHIEVIYPFDDEGVCVICNEEGKINGMEPNRAIYDKNGTIRDIIAGPFLVAGVGIEEFISLTEEQIIKYENQFHRPEYIRYEGDRPIVFSTTEKSNKDERTEKNSVHKKLMN